MTGFREHRVDKVLDLSVPVHISKEIAWKRIENKIREENGHTIRSFPLYRKVISPMIATAASLVLIATIFLTRLPQQEKQACITDSGSTYSIFLPDSSEVVLNAETELQFNPEKWNRKRIIELNGEAFFNVKKGKRFIVRTHLGNVTVLGTSFNVLSRNNSFQVSCFTGKVSVESSDKKASTTLSQGQFVEYLDSDQFSTPEAFDPDRVASWHCNELFFTNTPFIKVLSEFEEQYNVTVTTQNTDNRFYTGSFPKNDLKKALNLICVPMNMRYRIINESEIEIKNK
ncbi:MAG: FecR family protein [Bacteroidales bacterium]|nr:FecR family protein [Bacteroidales bacterium]